MNTYVPPSWPSVPPPPQNQSHPARPRQSTWLSSLHRALGSYELSVLHLAVVTCESQSQFILSPAPCPSIQSLCLHLYACPTNPRLHIHMLRYDMFFLFLTYFTLYERLYIHPQDTENCINVSRNKTCIFRWWKSGKDFITPHLDLRD